MPTLTVTSLKNQYRGVNAHLHSIWQAQGGWDSFHFIHIGDLFKTLRGQLRPMGYTADVQQALQIRRSGQSAGRPESDISIYDTLPERLMPPAHSPQHVGSAGELVLTMPEVLNLKLEEIAPYRAIGIYDTVPGRSEHGQPVAWIELLSPSNKPGGQDAAYYYDKCLKLLQSGIVLVEIDYLHETPPTFTGIPNYRAENDDDQLPARAYRINVIDPRPEFLQGHAQIHQFDVDVPIPVVQIPLNAGDTVACDFDGVYQRTFEEALYGDMVDYGLMPPRFNRYRREDQARIAARMLAIIKAAQAGIDLETDTLNTEDLLLETALQQIKVLQDSS